MKKYILNDKIPVVESDLIKWAEWYENANRHVKLSKLQGGVKVSTVFLGIDHSFGGNTPILFETMIFGGRHDGYCDRHSTWEKAEKGHEKALMMISE